MSESTTAPIPVPKEFTKNHLAYREIRRSGMLVMLEVALRKGAEPCAYEVCRIRVLPPCVIMGRPVPLREALPGNEEFGSRGWSWATRAQAEKCFDRLVAAKEKDGGTK